MSDRAAWAVIDRAQAGDVDAFADLYRAHRDQVHNYIRGRLGHEVADDLTHEVFIRALRYIGTLTYTGKPPVAWLMTITRNAVIDYTRGNRYRHETYVADVDDVEIVDTDPGPELEAERAEIRRIVHAALAQLLPAHRRVLTLRFLEGLDTYETAAAMGKTFDQVKALQYRATRAIAKHLSARETRTAA